MRRVLLFLYCLTLPQFLSAQTAEKLAEEAHLASINALLIFTSQDSLTSGIYRFVNISANMEVYHLPFTYHFKSDKRYNYFIVGNVGYSRSYLTSNVTPPAGTTLTYENHIRTYTAGIGGGLRYKTSESTSILGGLEVIYSRSGSSLQTNDTHIDDTLKDLFNQDYSDNITYKFFTLAEYRPEDYKFKPYASVAFKLYQTKSSINVDSLRTFTTQSNVTTLTFGAETPKLFGFDEKYLTLEGYINGNYLGGDVAKAAKFDSYETFGAVTYLYTPGYKYAKRFFVEISTVRSYGLEGYNFGVGFTARF